VVASSLRKPLIAYWKSVTVEILKNPLGAAFVFVVGFYIRVKARYAARDASPTWEVLESSKELD